LGHRFHASLGFSTTPSEGGNPGPFKFSASFQALHTPKPNAHGASWQGEPSGVFESRNQALYRLAPPATIYWRDRKCDLIPWAYKILPMRAAKNDKSEPSGDNHPKSQKGKAK